MPMIGLRTRRMVPPHAPEEWFEVREALSPYHVQQAREAQGHDVLEMQGAIVQAFGSVERFQEVVDSVRAYRSAPALPVEAPVEVLPADVGTPAPIDTRSDYDLDVAAAAAVKSWGYRGAAGGPLPVSLANIRLLDGETRAWLHGIVWEAMRPVVEGESPGN